MKVSSGVKRLIRENEAIINSGDFVGLYEKRHNYPKGCWSEFINLVLMAGVNPLEGADRVPSNFLTNTNFDNGILPEGLRSIEKNAFNETLITKVVAPHSLDKLNHFAFADMGSVEEIDLLKSEIKEIPQYCFMGNPHLRLVKLPISLIKIDWYAFLDCESLKTIYYPGTIEDFNKIEKDTISATPLSITCRDGKVEVK